MRQVKYRFVVALVTFLIGVFIATAVAAVWRISRIEETEEAPCKACAALYTQAEIPSVSVCDLKNKLDFYRGKVVRVRASFHNDAGLVNLLDDTCPGVALKAKLGDECQSCIGARKALTIYSGFGTWYDSTARVVVLGKVSRLGLDDDSGFNIDCVERAGPMDSGRQDRLRYAEGEIFGLSPR